MHGPYAFVRAPRRELLNVTRYSRLGEGGPLKYSSQGVEIMPKPRKTRARQKHQVDVNLRERDITRAGTSLELEAFAEGEKLGDLTVGSGSVIWRGRGRQSSKRIGWSKFAEMMDQLAYGD